MAWMNLKSNIFSVKSLNSSLLNGRIEVFPPSSVWNSWVLSIVAPFTCEAT